MKKITALLFAVCLLINAGFAQRLNPGQKVIVNNQNAQEWNSGSKTASCLLNPDLPFVFTNSNENLLKSGSTIKLDSIIISERSSESEPWVKFNKQIFEYDDEPRLVKITTTSGLDDWGRRPEMALLKYNASGFLDSVKLYYRDGQMAEMSLYRYFKFSYDDSGKLFKIYSYSFYDNNWELSMGYNYSYNQSGKVSEIFLEENWWFYYTSLHNYTYDLDGKLILYSAPLYGIRATYEYDSEGNLVEENFGHTRTDNFYYNAEGDRIKTERYYWSDGVLREHKTLVYNYLNMNSSELIDLDLSFFSLTNELDEVRYCPNKLVSSILENTKKTDYYYSSIAGGKIITGTAGSKKEGFKVYPNPATEQVTFTWKASNNRLSLKLYHAAGACVMEREISSGIRVNLDHLPRGIYLFKLADENQPVYSGKLVID